MRLILSGTHLKIIKSAAAIKDISASSLPKSRQILFIMGAGENYSDAAECICSIKEQRPSARVVVLAEKFEPAGFISALQAGASGYLLKTIGCDALIKSLDLVLLGQIVLPSEFQRLICGTSDGQADTLQLPAADVEIQETSYEQPLRKLSDRENMILRSMMRGETNKSIARELGITDSTVKVHVKSILRKVGASNRTQAAVWAVNHLPNSIGAAPINGHGGVADTSLHQMSK